MGDPGAVIRSDKVALGARRVGFAGAALPLAIALVLALLGPSPSEAGRGAPPGELAGFYAGKTEQGKRITFRVSRDGRVRNFTFVVVLRCFPDDPSSTSFTPLTTTRTMPSVKIVSRGKSRRFAYDRVAPFTPAGNLEVVGKIGAGSADLQGSIEITSMRTSSGMCRIYHGEMGWAAKRK